MIWALVCLTRYTIVELMYLPCMSWRAPAVEWRHSLLPSANDYVGGENYRVYVPMGDDTTLGGAAYAIKSAWINIFFAHN